jgi:hypothetical protein
MPHKDMRKAKNQFYRRLQEKNAKLFGEIKETLRFLNRLQRKGNKK